MSITQKGYTANLEGLSTDTKPTDVELNTIFHALDTDKYYYFDGTDWNEMPNSGGGGSGFTPTTEQLAAMNSGITSTDVEQIGTNKNNISTVQSHFKSDDTRELYISATAPTGAIADNSTWIDGKTIYSYTGITLTNTEQGGIASADGQDTSSPSRVRTTFADTPEQQGAHTISAGGDAQQVVVYVYDSSKTYLPEKSIVSWQNMPFRFNTDGDYYVRFVFRKTNDTALSPSQVSDIVLKSWQ